MSERDLFIAALNITEPAERGAWLDRECGSDAAMRQRIDQLLRAFRKAGSLLEDRAGAMGPTMVAPIAERPGTVIDRYTLLEQIGEGGFGVVYMAEQAEPVRRKVAVKVLKPGMDTRQVIARFEAERQALALMDHLHIATVFDGGSTASGRPYFVMELVQGVPITEYCDQQRLSPRERLELFIPVCHAVQHAHQKGIIHRDLKPSNVLVTVRDTEPVVKVIDFGVAKAAGPKLTEATQFTGFGTVIGTPEYMSPEQAQLDNIDIDTRSDIYSLGVLLYELLTGSPPFTKEDLEPAGLMETLRVIREREPTRPSTKLSTAQGLPTLAADRGTEPAKLTKLVRGELDWIVMKCLEKDRNRRYETASALTRDIEHYLHDEPVVAGPPSAAYRFRKFARRNKAALVTAMALASAVLLAVSVLATSIVLIAREQKATATALYFHRVALAHHHLSVENLREALKSLEECPEDLRGWEWNYLMRLCKVEPLIIRDETEVNGVAFSADGELLASAGGDGTVKIRNSRTGEVIQRIKQAHSEAVVSVAFHPDGKHLASLGTDRQVKVWDLTATDQAVFTEPCHAVRKFGTAYTVAFSRDGRLLAAASDEVVKVWDWKNRHLLQSLPGHNFHSIAVAFSRDGRLATGGLQDVKVWNPETGLLLRPIHAYDHPAVSALAFSRDGKWLASAALRGPVKLWNSTTGTLVHNFELHSGNVECAAFSPDGRYLASGGEDKTVRVWDAATGGEILGLHGHTDRCGCVAFSPDGWRLASASSDETIRIWNATPLRGDEHQETLIFDKHRDEVRGVAFGPEGWRIASAGDEGLVKVWDAQTGWVSAEFSDHRDPSGQHVTVFSVAWHPKGHLIASAGLDTVRVWDDRTTNQVFFLPADLGKIPYHVVAFSPDGRYLATGKLDGVVQVWDGGTGQEIDTLDTCKREVRGLVFSRDGKYLASASGDGIVKIWNAKRLDKLSLDEKQEPRKLRARVAGPGVNIAFSPDGQRLATGGEKNTVKIWDVQSGELLQTLEGHHGDVYTLAFSPDDGRWVASGGEDSAVKVWDSQTGTLVRSFRGHMGLVSSVAFSPDGRYLVSGSRDKTVRVWDMTQLQDATE